MRQLTTLLLYFLLNSCITGDDSKNKVSYSAKTTWDTADSILMAVKIPVFSPKEYLITDFGAKSDGKKDCTESIQSAIDKASTSGGGTVIIPPGRYLTMPVRLKSNVNLHLKENSVLSFIPDLKNYQMEYTWYRGIPCMNYTAMIYASGEENIAITGKGTLDGQGDLLIWKEMKHKEELDGDLLEDMANEEVKAEYRRFGYGHHLIPDMISFISCNSVLIDGISGTGIPRVFLHPILSAHCTIRNVNIRSKGYEVYGIIPECCQMMVIDSLKISGLSDGIMIKAGRKTRKKEPLALSSQNIVIRNIMLDSIGYNAVGIGTEVSYGVNNIFIKDIKVKKAKRGFTIKANQDNGGTIKNILVKNFSAENITDPVLYINSLHDGEDHKKVPAISCISFDRIGAINCGRALYFEGSSKEKLDNISIENGTFATCKPAHIEEITNFQCKNVSLNGSIINHTFDAGDSDYPKELGKKEKSESLDSDDITVTDLPAPIKDIADKQNIAGIINEIERKITKTGVIYDISYKTQFMTDFNLLISESGEIIRSDEEINYEYIPQSVITALDKIMGKPFRPQLLNEAYAIRLKDYFYYDIQAETMDEQWRLEIDKDGKVLEKITRKLIPTFPIN